jgi:hypothetical protein
MKSNNSTHIEDSFLFQGALLEANSLGIKMGIYTGQYAWGDITGTMCCVKCCCGICDSGMENVYKTESFGCQSSAKSL